MPSLAAPALPVEVIVPTGSECAFEWALGDTGAIVESTKVPGSQIHFVQLPGRLKILQCASATDPAHESFPSVFLRATIADAGPANLAGRSAPAQMFLQKTPEGPVWHSSREMPLKLTIVATEPDSFRAEFTGALASGSTLESIPISGKLTGQLNRLPATK